MTWSSARRIPLALAAIAAVFLAIALPGAGSRGVTSEEVQPYLTRYPFVLDLVEGRAQPMPPYEPGAPPRPRWVATPQWPVLAYDGEKRVWPVFIRGHQTALGSYFGIALGPLLGGGVAGLQRSSVLLTLLLLPLAYLLARRSWSFRRDGSPLALLAPGLLALTFGTIFFGRTGYAFEIASRVGMMAALVAAARLEPLTGRRALLAGLAAGIAVLCRATIAVTLAPALAILLAHPARRAPWSRRAVVPLAMAALPLAVLGLFALLAPFREGTAPLADFPLHSVWKRAADVPGHLFVQLAWLGDAQSILGPVRSGAPPFRPLVVGALVGAIPVNFAVARWWRGVAGDGERMLVAGLLGNAVGGAFIYGQPSEFQLAMALDPLLAVAVAEQVAAIAGARRAAGVAAIALAVRAQSVVFGLALDGRGTNPMFSGSTQRGAVAMLEELGVRGEELVTTTYNQAGVIEAWTEGSIRPVHAWPVLRSGGPGDAPHLGTRFAAVLDAHRPRYVLLSEGANPYEGSFTDNAAISAALFEIVARKGGRIERQWAFPTESGAPGWRLVSVVYP
ncbi:hypothetical protein [Polyangium aurulentum]|uniref:hypothetical protein n=1 Tax=Polyangium aurulentum TaxID=2567896 RepID=UPI0010AE01E7|nr:hypothetical protein [Polyangium aurulentum]UQA60139.1 hypothetical protein E8A73_006545 [Polyangium aurulentum]